MILKLSKKKIINNKAVFGLMFSRLVILFKYIKKAQNEKHYGLVLLKVIWD
jgi:hypothetical protein